MIENKFIDLTVTSPPYDNLRTYNNSLVWGEHIWKPIIKELYRITKDGGIVIWIVGDATIKGSETGTSFRQALYFKEIGFNLHDTMIYKKQNPLPLTQNRYEQCFEYMFVFSKGKPKTFNPITELCKYAGKGNWGKRSVYKNNDGKLIELDRKAIKDKKIHTNIFEYLVGSIGGTGKINHPAMFPEKLAQDHILSWSNEGDMVLDPMCGSGTVGIVCKNLKRNFIGIEKDESYFKIAKERIEVLV